MEQQCYHIKNVQIKRHLLRRYGYFFSNATKVHFDHSIIYYIHISNVRGSYEEMYDVHSIVDSIVHICLALLTVMYVRYVPSTKHGHRLIQLYRLIRMNETSKQTIRPRTIIITNNNPIVNSRTIYLWDGQKVTQILVFLQRLSFPLTCLLYTSPSPRDRQKSRMPSSA